MRCLRCAIDYPAEERYCHRCGRALSRPPGATADAGTAAMPRDNAYVYSTHAPPLVGDAAPAEAPNRVAEPPSPAGSTYGTPSRYRTPPPVDAERAAAVPSSRAADADPAPARSDIGAHALPWDLRRGDRLPADDEGADDRPADERTPSLIGIDTTVWRVKARRRTGARRLLIVAAALLLLLALILALVGVTRHAAYQSDLQAARGLAAAGQYPAALARYQTAIGDWPFNGAAKDEQAAARARATVLAMNMQATAAMGSTRDAMFADRAARRLTAAQQADAAAAATATAVVQAAAADAQATVTARQTATVIAQIRASGAARAQATATAVALAVGTARAEASATVATLAAHGAAPVIYAALSASDGVGVGATDPATESWVADLAQKLPSGSNLVNPSQSGAHLSDGLQSELPTVLASHPTLVTVWLVVNDINARVPLATYRAELDTLLGTLRSQTHAAIYVGNAPDLTLLPLYRSLDRAQVTATVHAYNAIIAQEAALHKATLVDLYTESERTLPAHPEYVSGDGFHPSTPGYADLANYWWSVIQGSAR